MALFKTITYHISPSLPPTLVSQLDAILQANGGKRASGTKDPSLNTVIADSLRFDGWEDVAARRAAASATSTTNTGSQGHEGTGNVDVVTPNFIERSVIFGKLQSPQHYSVDPAMFFSGVTACGADLPSSDLEVLSGGITGLGGQWRSALTSECTHLFAISPDSAKYQTAMHYQKDTGIKVVLPHWFDDCVRLGIRGLSEEMYEWPECRILKGPEGLLPPPKERAKLKSTQESKAANGVDREIEGERERMRRNLFLTAAKFTPSMNRSSPPSDADLTLVAPPSSSVIAGVSARGGLSPTTNGNTSLRSPAVAMTAEPHAVWEGRKILLSRTLQLYGGRREAVQAGIERVGGQVLRFEGDEEEQEDPTVVAAGAPAQGQGWNEKLGRKERRRRRREAELIEECDVYVTRWRQGRAYIQAVREHKMVGTLAWLFHVQSCGIITHPINQLLHYPVPKRPIEAFQNHVITVTNYTGEAREYLKKLVSAMGAEFTPSMSGSNTVLVAAYTSGTKAQKALSWSIPVVNHLWLEDCFISWRNLTVANEKYIIFRPGDDFSKRLGERGLAVGVANGISGAYGSAKKAKEGQGQEPEQGQPNLIGGEAGVDVELGRIEQEAEELAEDMLEGGDDLGNSDDDAAEEERERAREMELELEGEGEKGLQIPGGTEASMKQVVDDLVPDPSGGGIDFAMDVDQSVGFDDAEVEGRITSTPKKAKEGKNGKIAKPSFHPSPAVVKSTSKTRVAQEKKKKSKVSKSSDEEDQEEEDVVVEDENEEDEPPKKAKGAKPTKATPVVLLSKTSPTKAKANVKSKAKAKAPSPSPSEDEDDAEDVPSPSPVPPPKKSKTTAKPKCKQTPPPTSSEEEVEENEEPEDDDDEMDVDPPPKAKRSKDKGGKTKENENEKQKKKSTTTKSKTAKKTTSRRSPSPMSLPAAEEEEESTGPPPTPPPATKGKTKTKPKETSKAVAPRKVLDIEDDDDDETQVISATSKAKPTAPVPATQASGVLLGRVKGDARTRIKRKKEKPKPVVESEDEEEGDDVVVEEEEEEEVVLPVKKTSGKSKQKKNGKEIVKDAKGRKKAVQAEDDDDDDDEVEVTSSKAKSASKTKTKGKKVQDSSDEEEVEPPPKKRTKKPSPPPVKAKGRSKPMRVYSTAEEDVDEEQEDEIPAPASEGSDSDLPENPVISKRPQKPVKGKENDATSSSKSKKAKNVDDKAKKKKVVQPSDTEPEEEEPPVKTTPRKANGKPSPVKRVVSVLMPSLKLSPSKASIGKETSGSKTKGKRKAAASSEEDEDDNPKPPAKSTKKPTAKPKPAQKPSKAKPPSDVESEDDSEEEEKEVSVLVSPRAARALARTDSLRAVSGQVTVSPSKTIASTSIANAIRQNKASKNANTNATASSSRATTSAAQKNTKPKPSEEPMDVDDESTSTGPVSGPLPRRNAAAKANQRLHDTIMPDLLQYEAQKKKSKRFSSSNSAAFAFEDEERVSQTSEKRKQADDDADEGKAAKKRRVSNVVLEDDDDDAPPPKSNTKGKGKGKAGTAADDAMDVDDKKTPGTGIVVMTTQVTLSEDVIKALGKLGVKMTSRPAECTHLLAPHVVRTEKFLCALASRAPWILQEKWATESARAKKILPEKDFILRDKSGENKYGVNLVDALKRAKELKDKGGLLNGHTFYITPKVPIDNKLLKNVVVACGGVISTQVPTLRIINTAPRTRHVISCKEDIAIWRPIVSSRTIKIYTQELVLTGILNQKMEWDKEEFFVAGSS